MLRGPNLSSFARLEWFYESASIWTTARNLPYSTGPYNKACVLKPASAPSILRGGGAAADGRKAGEWAELKTKCPPRRKTISFYRIRPPKGLQSPQHILIAIGAHAEPSLTDDGQVEDRHDLRHGRHLALVAAGVAGLDVSVMKSIITRPNECLVHLSYQR